MMTMMLMTFSLTFILMKHPLSMGLILLSQTILTSLITGMMSPNFWFSYILFLIMIGGMLVLFIYMTSIASNEMFKFSLKILFMIITMMIISMIMYITMDQLMSTMLNNNFMQNNYNWMLSMNKFINYPSNFIMFMMIIYLFITLIAIVKITNFNMGPMRQKF
uniref:NADH-ubiquinone oxidoreductase chain 6 n=1 Tax=Staphylinidae sp. BMNH 1274643 TaxID=1796584 RepID=A0A126TFV4_9COLE|nr:NADH dehydrogenase subunit 6 [Staphylinidae sp. BMNH 1274643]